MSEMAEAYKELRNHVRCERKERWENRDAEWFQPLRDEGYTPITMNEGSKHCRVTARVAQSDVYVYFDFWPTTGRWMRVIIGSAPVQNKGRGLFSMMNAIRRLV